MLSGLHCATQIVVLRMPSNLSALPRDVRSLWWMIVQKEALLSEREKIIACGTSSLASPITSSIGSMRCCPGTGGRAFNSRWNTRCASYAFRPHQAPFPRYASSVLVNLPINEQSSHAWPQRGRRDWPDAYTAVAFLPDQTVGRACGNQLYRSNTTVPTYCSPSIRAFERMRNEVGETLPVTPLFISSASASGSPAA
jgi:hypothetical protein